MISYLGVRFCYGTVTTPFLSKYDLYNNYGEKCIWGTKTCKIHPIWILDKCNLWQTYYEYKTYAIDTGSQVFSLVPISDDQLIDTHQVNKWRSTPNQIS